MSEWTSDEDLYRYGYQHMEPRCPKCGDRILWRLSDDGKRQEKCMQPACTWSQDDAPAPRQVTAIDAAIEAEGNERCRDCGRPANQCRCDPDEPM